MLTQCPQCESRFRVAEKQLQAAKGKVRCGHCMTVFNALANLVSETSLPANAKAPDASEEMNQDKAGNNPFVKALEKQKQPPVTAEEPPATAEPAKTESVKTEPVIDEEELIFEDNPEEDQTEKGYTGGLYNESELSDSFRDLQKSDGAHDFGDDENDDDKLNADESWAEAMLQEDAPRLRRNEPALTEGPEFSMESDPAMPARDVSASDVALRAEPRPGLESYRKDPVRLHEREELTGNSLKKIVIGLVLFILVMGLIVQLAYYHYEKLARFESIRPIYVTVCDQLRPLTGCQLPELVDIDQIRSENLVVRSHPLARDALIIDASIVNDAGFPQPYPAINLSFADLNNNVVARRVFQPAEYLPKDRDIPAELPSRTPVFLSLELQDPGKEAVNYTITFLEAAGEPEKND